MAVIKVPSNVSSLTLATSGVLVPDGNGLITCTALEATDLCKAEQWGPGPHCVAFASASGQQLIFMPSTLLSITINGITRTRQSNGQSSGFFLPADINTFMFGLPGINLAEFQLITG